MKQKIFLMLSAAMLMLACAQQPQPKPTYQRPASAEGDSTIYGLACDGCNDTILIYLNDPYDGSAPDTLNILEASRARQVFGSIRIGDKVAAVRDTANPKRARLVIVTQDLLGQWCYKVKPTLKRRAGADVLSVEHFMEQMPDSLRGQLDAEREYGFTLKVDSVALPIGYRQAAADADAESPLEYPALKRYRQWYIRNGQLLLTEARPDSLGNATPAVTDTAELVMLTPDTLVLRFPSGEQSYYRKQEAKE